MVSPGTVSLMTAEELAEMPDDGHRYELVRGELVRLPMSSIESSVIAMRIGIALGAFVYPAGLGWIAGADGAFILERQPDTTRIPDVSFIRADRFPPPGERRHFAELAPDLAVEVLSPSDRTSETNDKVLTYLDAGVQLIWIVDPPRRIVTVYTPDSVARVLRETDELDGGDVLPGFRLRIADIFL
jgi:Uma2 family endonuclease